ncbi:hypothetical protein AB6A23_26090 [Paenibacillus tarimensis]
MAKRRCPAKDGEAVYAWAVRRKEREAALRPHQTDGSMVTIKTSMGAVNV